MSKLKYVVFFFLKESRKKLFYLFRKEYLCFLVLNLEFIWNILYFFLMIINGMRKGFIIVLFYKELNKIFNLVFYLVCVI